jgi:hypothetical protein
MRHQSLEPLSDEAESLLANERPLVPESFERRQRAMARARAALREPHASLTRAWRSTSPLFGAAALAVAFGAAAAAGWNGLARRSEPSPNALPAATGFYDAPAPAARASVPAEEAPAPEHERVAPVPADSKADSKAPPRRSSNDDASDSYVLELRVLQRARTAVARSEFSSALEATLDHQRRFPAGRLVEEREALRIKALAGLGRNDEAERAAGRFRDRFPRSVLTPRVEETARRDP